MKKNIFKIITVFTIALLITGCGTKKKEETTQKQPDNPNNQPIKYQTVKDLKFGTASFFINDNDTYISTSIINDTNNDIKVNSFYVLLKDSDGNIIKKEKIDLGVIKAKETKEITEHKISGKYQKTAKIDYEIE